MRIFFLMFLASTPLANSALAETEYEFSTDLTLLASVLSEKNAGSDVESLMGELSFEAGAERVLENGVKISGALTWRLQTDHPDRPGFAGQILSCPPAFSACPNSGVSGVRGSFSRISTLPFADEAGARGNLERAYIEIDGGWGSVTLGRDEGIGARFYEGGPSVFSHARDHDPILDPSGIVAARVRNDISSIGTKISAVTPRILGLRAGASYTPDASVRALDLDTQMTAPGVLEPEIGSVWEAGLQYSQFFRSADLRVRASLTWSQAESENSYYDDTSTTSFGFELERSDVFRAGASMISSDNGGHGNYSAFAAGGEWYLGDWRIGLNGARAEDDFIGFTSRSTTIGASRGINALTDMTIGYRDSSVRYDFVIPGGENRIAHRGVLLEVRIRK